MLDIETCNCSVNAQCGEVSVLWMFNWYQTGMHMLSIVKYTAYMIVCLFDCQTCCNCLIMKRTAAQCSISNEACCAFLCSESYMLHTL